MRATFDCSQSPTYCSYLLIIETLLLELQSGCHGNVMSSAGTQSNVDDRQSGTGSLPKRAETFTAFDSKQKSSGNTLSLIHI